MQSALRMLLIFCIASRVPARYARSRRFAMMPSIPPSLLEPAPGVGDLQTAGTRHADRYGRNSERDRLSDWTLVQVNPNSGQAISRAPRTHALARQGGQGGYHES